MTDVLEKAIAELDALVMSRPPPSYPVRLAMVRDSLRALVEAQKSAKPGEAAERLARNLELNGHGHWAAEIRALGREHAAEIGAVTRDLDYYKAEYVTATANADDLRKSLDARVAELSEAHAAMNGMMPKGTPCSEHEAKSERATNRAIAAEAKANELAAERDAARAEAKRLREALKQTARWTADSRLCWCSHAKTGAVYCQGQSQCKTANAALSDKGSGTDPASGSQGASSAPPGSQAAPEPARCPGCQHASHPGLRRCDECGFECAQRNGRIFPPPGYKAAVAKLQSTPTNPTTGWPEPTHAKCVGCGETRTICCADLAPIGEPMQNARCQACCPKHAPGMQRTWSTAELITFIRAESGRDALAAELAKTDAVVFALASKHRTRTPAHHPGFNGCKRCDCGWEPPRREWMDDSYVSRAEYEQDAKATTEVESQLAERIEALERHATAQVVIDKAAASHAANRVREVEGRVAAMKARLAAVSDAQDALNVQRLKHEGVTRELVGEVHDGDCPDLDEALRAAGWDK